MKIREGCFTTTSNSQETVVADNLFNTKTKQNKITYIGTQEPGGANSFSVTNLRNVL